MSGVALDFKVIENGVAKVGEVLLNRLQNHEDFLYVVGATMEASIQRNFEEEGRPKKWDSLSPETLKNKPNTKILQVKGHGGGLLGSIHFEVMPNSVQIGTNKIYAAIHQFGGQAGRGHKITIPAREYLLVQDEDWREIRQLGTEFFTGDIR